MKRQTVSITKQRAAYARNNGICVICGKKISPNEKEWSVDHYIPRAVYKWVPDKVSKDLIESQDNLFIVHQKCNFSKDSTLPTNQAISSMHANKEIKDKTLKLYNKTQDGVDTYRAIKQSTFDSQGKKCAVCGKKLTINDATLRRISNNKGRNRDNAMCVCERCNIKAGTTEQKRKMVKKITK